MGCAYEGASCEDSRRHCEDCDYYIDPKANPPQHTAQGIRRHRDTDYDQLHKDLNDEAKHLNSDYLNELIYQAKVLRFRQGHSESPTVPTRPQGTPEPRLAPHGQGETFQSLCEQSKNPLPLKPKWFGERCTFQCCQWEGNEESDGPDYKEAYPSLIFCKHRDNSSDFEGNCDKKTCPLKGKSKNPIPLGGEKNG